MGRRAAIDLRRPGRSPGADISGSRTKKGPPCGEPSIIFTRWTRQLAGWVPVSPDMFEPVDAPPSSRMVSRFSA